MTNNDEVTHMAQVLCAIEHALDLEEVQAHWGEYMMPAYGYEARKLIGFADALAAHRAATAITGKVVPA